MASRQLAALQDALQKAQQAEREKARGLEEAHSELESIRSRLSSALQVLQLMANSTRK